MLEKDAFLHLREKLDATLTHLTRNHIQEFDFGTVRATIYQRRRGSWIKLQTPHSPRPIRGKTNDIIYTYDPATTQTERKRLGDVAKNPETSMLTKNPKRNLPNEIIYYPKRNTEKKS